MLQYFQLYGKIYKTGGGLNLYRIAVCDDNAAYAEFAAERIKQYCAQHDRAVSIRVFSDSDLLVDLIEQKQLFDVYVLDVEMPCYSGLDVVKKIREYTSTAVIILLTAYTLYAIEACGMDIFSYVVKENYEKELDLVMDSLFARLQQQKDEKIYIIENKKKFIKLDQRDIIYIHKDQKNAVFNLTGGREERERLTLQEVHKKLDNPDMLFLERGNILNLNHIRRVLPDLVEMDNDYRLYLGRDHIRELKDMLNKYWGGLI